MKKIVYSLGCLMIAGAMIACGGAKKDAQNAGENADSIKKAENAAPQYTVVEKPQIDLSKFAKDKDGFITIFDGKTFEGWRGYGKDAVPGKWTIDQGAIKFNGTGGGEAQDKEGGDIIFAHKFKNFELTFDWKVAKGSNSGVFFLAQEIETTNDKGEKRMEPIYISSPEYQILDNANHPDAKMGKDNNRQSASLYDMIPAVPQNSKPFGEWNTGKIMVYKGTVVHGQNGENVVEYHLWTPQWTELLQASKFSQEKWPLAFELLNNLGGTNREGYIGFQDHGDDVWFRNIKIKILD
ncbi:MAG: DUF1080 domain-containing protein [Prevotella sp.]|uniref:3-keto-disaccharide hydrolase n=1 Tax=unclassified Dysgonomonas TaxID=2630389 RepID=UPI0025C2E60D|nr:MULTISPECIES: DUF1080 domain-containing protein [unclassified Dysgonomonas]MDR1715740.1 DUF1080 domain-containing protein [Prevotella sp.]MDR2003161.1 DUF1080 domain-containing protein [Prevotella sp.]HMM02371.1 DUF1080 domain-containing protein [Dysgonomonas sp.]